MAFVAGLPAPSRAAPRRVAEDGPDPRPAASCSRRSVVRPATYPDLGAVEGIYSDLLLHDMGTDLADSGSYYGVIESPSAEGARSREWRTPPLWGFRDSGPYLHDGRAETLEEAVAMHGGQGQPAAHKFFGLKPRERLQVQTFLNSLVARLGRARALR